MSEKKTNDTIVTIEENLPTRVTIIDNIESQKLSNLSSEIVDDVTSVSDEKEIGKSLRSGSSLWNIQDINYKEQISTSSNNQRNQREQVNLWHRMVRKLSIVSQATSTKAPSKSNALHPISRNAQTMSQRQICEIQLNALLNEPDQPMPKFAFAKSEMSLENVSKELNTPPFVVERLLKVIESLYENENSTFINERNVSKLMRILTSTRDVRILFFFMMLDENHDNSVTKDEMNAFLQIYFKSIKFNINRTKDAIEILLHKFHLDQKSQIDFEEFYTIVTEDSAILETFSRFTVNPTWYSGSSAKHGSNENFTCCSNCCFHPSFYDRHGTKLTPQYLNTNLPRVVLLLIYISTNIALSLYVIIYRSTVLKNSVFVVFARIGGMLLNFNCSLILFLMLKQTILYIRSNRYIRQWIPVDDHIDFHKFVGRFIVFLTFVHAIGHFINFARTNDFRWEIWMFTTKPGLGWVGGFASLSGVILSLILAIMVISSLDFMRQKGYFQVFYWVHHLYLLFYIFLIIHAPTCWKWVIGPFAWFVVEKVYSNIKRYSSRSGRTYIYCATIEQSNVISLTIRRPKHFTFKPGDYININLPRVALYEFHPFTISSAPEDRDILRVHIQINGNWTDKVYQRFKDMSENKNQNENHVKVYRNDLNLQEKINENEQLNDENESENEETNKSSKEIVIINGPYSSCARYIFDCKHVILIGGGIGVTPYASILSSLMFQFRESRILCKNCQTVNYHRQRFLDNHRIRKVDFIWVSRDHKNFEWFFKILNEFEKEQEEYLKSNPDESRFLTIHLYLTEIKSDDYIGSYPLQLITQVWAQVSGTDIFTGLKSRTHIGRPSWDKIFNEIHLNDSQLKPHDVNVFFCGPVAMSKSIQQSCIKHRFRFYEEKF